MKRVVITGASRGIGKATAEKFLSEGWEVVGTSTSGHGWEHANLSWAQLDLADPKSIEDAAKEVANKGKFDVLVNNAGVLLEDEEPLTAEHLRKTLEVNVVGTGDFTVRLLPNLTSPAHIINMSSMSAGMNDPIENTWHNPAYKISKAALNMFTRTMARQLKPQNITVSSIDPGWVKTDLAGDEAPREPHEAAQEVYDLATSNVPTGRFWLNGKERDW